MGRHEGRRKEIGKRGRRSKKGKNEEKRNKKWKNPTRREEEEKGEYRREQRGSRRKRVVSRREKDQLVIMVGTGRIPGGRRKSRARKENGEELEGVVMVTEVWVSGRLTNNKGRSDYVRRKRSSGAVGGAKAERRYARKRKGMEKWLSEEQRKRPGRVVFRNPEDHEVARKEARRCGIPTVGRVTKKRKKDRVPRRTYGRPRDQGKEGKVVRGRRRKRALRNEKNTTKI